MTFTLRPWRREDVISILPYANNEKIARNLRDAFPHPYTQKDAEDFIASCLNTKEEEALVRTIDVDGEAVGSIGLFLGKDVYRKSGELGYWLAEPFWGQGIMTGAVSQMCQEGFDRFDIVRIYAEPYAHNLASRRVLEKTGFSLEGILRKSVYKRGNYLDSCIFALLRE